MKKTVLFRFLSAGPVKKDPKASSLGRAITFDRENIQQSHFLTQLDKSDFKTTKEHILTNHTNFHGLLTTSMIETRFAELLALFNETSNQRHDESFELLHQFININSLVELDSSEKTLLLDNLIFRLYGQSLAPEVELIQHILRANSFLKTYKNNTDPTTSFTELKSAIEATIVLPIEITNQHPEEIKVDQVDDASLNLIDDAHNILVAKHLVHEVELTEKEWNTSIKRFYSENQDSISATKTSPPSSLNSHSIDFAQNKLVSFSTIRNRISTSRKHILRKIDLDDDDDAALAELQIHDLKSELLLIAEQPILKSEPHTLFIEGSLLEEESAIPEYSVIVKPERVAKGLYDFYLSYYCPDPKIRITHISGTSDQDSTSHSVNVEQNLISDKEFQLFKLNDEPLSKAEAIFNLSLTLADPSNSQRNLSPFSTFEAIPHVDNDFTPFDDDIGGLFTPPPPFYAINRVGILNYYRVEQELDCYTLGEVSHIENILAREFKERLSRDLTRVNSEFEQENSYESSLKSDSETTTKNEMNSEIEDSIQKQISHSVDINASFGWSSSKAVGGPNVNISSGYAYNNDTTTNHAEKFAYNFAKEVTERVEHSINQKKRNVKKTTHTHEFEQNNKHGFDNRDGDEHVVGIYRWLDKIYTNYLVNYGKRMVYEFCIPDPAKNWRHAVKKRTKIDAFILKKTSSLNDLGINSYKDLKRNNYAKIASEYGVYVETAPHKSIILNQGYSYSVDVYPTHADEVQTADYLFSEKFDPIPIPEGYYAHKASMSGVHLIQSEDDPFLVIFVGSTVNPPKFGIEFDHKIRGNLDVSLSGMRISDFTFNLTVECKLNKSVMRDWQLVAYNKLKQSYEEHLAIYNEKLAEYKQQAEQSGNLKVNSRFQESLMKTELKRSCIEMMVKPWGIQIGGNYYKKIKGHYELQLSKKLDLDCQYVKFLEQAFDWELMTAIFYPYFYAQKKEWRERMFNDNFGKQNFKSFLNAGWSRLELPVRVGFESAVMFFFQTGEVFSGKGMITASDDNLYVSVADELAETEPVQIERSWKSKLPTNLTVLQSNASALNIDGLPCEIIDERLAAGDSQLGSAPTSDDDNE